MEKDEGGRDGVQFDVDVLILEYLVYNATRALLKKDATDSNPKNHLIMVDSFLAIFKTKHKLLTDESRLKFRIQLLQFTSLYVQRFDEPCPLQTDTTRDVSVLHAPLDSFQSNISFAFREKLKDQAPMSGAEMLQLYMVYHAATSDHLYATKPQACQSLLSLIKPFVSLTAARKSLGEFDGFEDDEWHVTPVWLGFAAELIVQACLEQWLVLEKPTPQVLVQALAATNVKTLFEPVAWLSVVSPYLDDIFNETPRAVLSKYPAHVFHEKMNSFLTALLDSLQEPELKQIEEGRMNGLPEEDTKRLLRRVGLS